MASKKTAPNMPPTSEWGPIYWKVMFIAPKILETEEFHSENGQVSEETKRGIADFFQSLTHMFPCPECKAHYRDLIASHPPDTSSKTALTEWLNFVGKEVKANQERMKQKEMAERAGIIMPSSDSSDGIRRITSSTCAAKQRSIAPVAALTGVRTKLGGTVNKPPNAVSSSSGKIIFK
jgi:hypothetical protein